MLLERYVKVANIYQGEIESEEELINKINETLSNETNVEITSKLDTNNLSKATFYYNFASYSIMAGAIYVICLIIYSFKEEKVRKRTAISSMNYKTHNRQLLLSNILFALVLWTLYVALSVILIGNMMFDKHGLVYILNSLIFTICAVTIAFLIGNIVSNKNAINGIVNVIALGSSFVCGAFVPMEWLPDTVLKIAHVLPSYYYIKSNEVIKTLEVIDFESLKPVITNMVILLGFSVIFIILSNVVSKKKMKIG